MSQQTYGADEIRVWNISHSGRGGSVMSFGRRKGTLDEMLSEIVNGHEDGKGYTSRLEDSEGNVIIELYSNGSPQLGEAIRDDYVVLNSVVQDGGSVWGRRRWRIFKAI